MLVDTNSDSPRQTKLAGVLSPLDVVKETNVDLSDAGSAHLATVRARTAASRTVIATARCAALEQLLHRLDSRCELGR